MMMKNNTVTSERKWLNTELLPGDADKLRRYLIDNGYKFETSGCFNHVHFEILLSETEADAVNRFLSAI